MSKEKQLSKSSEPKVVDVLYQKVSHHINHARANIQRTVDTEMVKAYWLIGRDIVEEEQQGSGRAKYGSFVIKELSRKLQEQYGRGFGVSTLEHARKFYIIYQEDGVSRISDALRTEFNPPCFADNLSWTHYRALMRVKRLEARQFYEKEASDNCWSSRELERQIQSLLFERLALSKDKAGFLQLAKKGQEITKPEDVIKEPFVLEFLGLPESHQLVESKLEEALVSNLQKFLQELGKGFSFVERQKRLSLDGDHYYADLVFYHVILKCYVVIDIKTHKLTHADLGQMQLYVNYFDLEIKQSDDNPTVGLVLCTQRRDEMAKYLLGDKAKQIFSSTYQLHLPTVEELETELKRELDMIHRAEK